MTRSRGWLRTAVLSFLLLPAIRVEADIPPPPDSPETKRVPVTIELDWGVFADRVSRKHVVASGDTLRSVAAKYLGDKAKWKAIVDANPSLAADPDHILVGATLYIPPVRALDAPTPGPGPMPPPEGGPPPPAPTPTPEPAPAEAAPLGPWYDAFWMDMHGNTNWTLGAPATPDLIPASYAAGGSFQLLPHAVAAKFRSDLDRKQVGREHEASAHALTAWVQGDGLVNKEDPTVRAVSRFRLTGVTDRSITVEHERLRYDAAGALVTRVWPIPPPSEAYNPQLQEALRKQREAGSASPVPVPIPVPAPGIETPAPAAPLPVPAPRKESDPPAMSGTLAIEPTAPPAAPEPAAREGGGGKTKPPLSPLVIVIASLVALALIGVVVLLRRGAGSTIAGTPSSSAQAPPPPTPPTSSAPPPSPGTSSAPDRFPPGSPPPVV